jgi:hypothetical protein
MGLKPGSQGCFHLSPSGASWSRIVTGPASTAGPQKLDRFNRLMGGRTSPTDIDTDRRGSNRSEQWTLDLDRKKTLLIWQVIKELEEAKWK